jgi:hypothetical protein
MIPHKPWLKKMDNDQLVFLLEVHKRIDMSFALSNIMLGLGSGGSTRAEILSILKHRKKEVKR